MPRAKRGFKARRRRNRILNHAEGFCGGALAPIRRRRRGRAQGVGVRATSAASSRSATSAVCGSRASTPPPASTARPTRASSRAEAKAASASTARSSPISPSPIRPPSAPSPSSRPKQPSKSSSQLRAVVRTYVSENPAAEIEDGLDEARRKASASVLAGDQRAGAPRRARPRPRQEGGLNASSQEDGGRPRRCPQGGRREGQRLQARRSKRRSQSGSRPSSGPSAKPSSRRVLTISRCPGARPRSEGTCTPSLQVRDDMLGGLPRSRVRRRRAGPKSSSKRTTSPSSRFRPITRRPTCRTASGSVRASCSARTPATCRCARCSPTSPRSRW